MPITQHCSSPIFSTFKHCPDCGDALKELPKLSTAIELSPDMLSPIKSYYPKAQLFTGRVQSTHLYTRRKTINTNVGKDRSSETIEHPYSFLTLEDRDGKIKKINVDASNTAAGKIAVDDPITILEPMPLTTPLPKPSGIANMLNDDLADAFIVHSQDKGQFGRKDMSKDFSEPAKVTFIDALITFFVSFVVTVLVAFIALLFFNPKEGSAAAIPVVLALVIAIFNSRSLYSKAKKQLKRHQDYSKVLDSLLDITYEALGYEHRAPKRSDSDIFCNHCDTRISAHVSCCPFCGNKNVITEHEEAPTQALTKNDSLTAETVESATSTTETSSTTESSSDSPASNSIKEKRLALMSKYQVETPEESYEHERLLWPSDKLTCSSQAGLYRVLDRNLFTESSVSVEGTDYSRKVYTQSGNYVGEIDDGSYTRKVTSINIEGKVLLEDCTGDIVEKEVYPDILGTLDVGDYVFLANQQIKKGKKSSDNYRVNASNMSKGIHAWPYDLRDYDHTSFIENMLPYVWFIAAIAIGITYDKLISGLNFHSIKQLVMEFTGYRLPSWADGADHWVIGILAFILLMVMHSLFVGRIDRGNRKRANKILKPIDDMHQAVIKDKAADQLQKYN